MEKKDFFYCYSPKLKRFLVENGVEYFHRGLNEKTEKYFWVFNRKDEKLGEYLTAWSEGKPNKESSKK